MTRTLNLLIAAALLATGCSAPAAAVQLPAPGATDTPQPTAAAPATPTLAATAAASTAACSPIPLAEGVIFAPHGIGNPDTRLVPVDPATGRPTCGYSPLEFKYIGRQAASADRSWLALAEFDDENFQVGRLYLLDLAAWQVAAVPDLTLTGWVAGMAFDPAGTRLTLAYGTPPGWASASAEPMRLVSLDVASLKVLHERPLDFTPRFMAYTPDMSELVLFGEHPAQDQQVGNRGMVALLSAADLIPVWEQALPDVLIGSFAGQAAEGLHLIEDWEPGLALAPDGTSLYVLHADAEWLTTLDLKAGRVRTVDVRPRLSLLDRLAWLTAGRAAAKAMNGVQRQMLVTADGRYLVAAGMRYTTTVEGGVISAASSAALEVQVIDAASGELATGPGLEAGELAWAADGRLLFASGWEADHAWAAAIDAGTMQTVSRLEGVRLRTVARIGGGSALLAEREDPRSGSTFWAVTHEAVVAGEIDPQAADAWGEDGYPLEAAGY